MSSPSLAEKARKFAVLPKEDTGERAGLAHETNERIRPDWSLAKYLRSKFFYGSPSFHYWKDILPLMYGRIKHFKRSSSVLETIDQPTLRDDLIVTNMELFESLLARRGICQARSCLVLPTKNLRHRPLQP